MNDTLPKDEQELRAALKHDLERHADTDVHLFAGFVISWMARNVALHQVEELVDQLDAAYPRRRAVPVEHDTAGWPVLRPSDDAPGTAWERHDDPTIPD